MGAATIPQLDAKDIARMVLIPHVLRHIGWRLRSRNRADCGLCRGRSTGTLAYRDHVWHCHRCHAGGDLYALLRAVYQYDFPSALRHAAEIAGVRPRDYSSVDVRKEVPSRRRQRERLEQAAVVLSNLERALRIEIRDQIHECERILAVPSSWFNAQWQRAHAACVLREDFLIPAYNLLSFGSLAERARYALHPELRAEMAVAIRHAGGVRADDGNWIEVLS
jgi:hypothetical protein